MNNNDTIKQLKNRIARLEHLLLNAGIATTYTLGREEFNYNWLVKIGINAEALDTEKGQEVVRALQIVSAGNWYKLRFVRGFYKANTGTCQNLINRVGELAREMNHGTGWSKGDDITWFLVSKNPKSETNKSKTEEPTF